MAEPQLSVRSTRARDLAHKLAAIEHRTVTQIIERALEYYARSAQPEQSSEPAADFYARLTREAATSIDLEELIQARKAPHPAITL